MSSIGSSSYSSSLGYVDLGQTLESKNERDSVASAESEIEIIDEITLLKNEYKSLKESYDRAVSNEFGASTIVQRMMALEKFTKQHPEIDFDNIEKEDEAAELQEEFVYLIKKYERAVNLKLSNTNITNRWNDLNDFVDKHPAFASQMPNPNAPLPNYCIFI
jgi:hypothetical protein